MPEHSPLPWTHEGVYSISDANDKTLFCSTDYYPWCSDNDADWPFIVRAVNSHQMLIDALRECREALAASMRVINAAVNDKADIIDCFVDEMEAAGVKNGVGVRADAAIRQAEGK